MSTYFAAIQEVKEWLGYKNLEDFIFTLVENGYDDLEAISLCTPSELNELENLFSTPENKAKIRILVESLVEVGIDAYRASDPSGVREFRRLTQTKKPLYVSVMQARADPLPTVYSVPSTPSHANKLESYVCIRTDSFAWSDKYAVLEGQSLRWLTSRKEGGTEYQYDLSKLQSMEQPEECTLHLEFDMTESDTVWLWFEDGATFTRWRRALKKHIPNASPASSDHQAEPIEERAPLPAPATLSDGASYPIKRASPMASAADDDDDDEHGNAGDDDKDKDNDDDEEDDDEDGRGGRPSTSSASASSLSPSASKSSSVSLPPPLQPTSSAKSTSGDWSDDLSSEDSVDETPALHALQFNPKDGWHMTLQVYAETKLANEFVDLLRLDSKQKEALLRSIEAKSEPQHPSLAPDYDGELAQIVQLLIEGGMFRKFKRGTSVKRQIWCSPKLDRIIWGSSDQWTVKGCLAVHDVTEIYNGVGPLQEQLNVVTPSRTLEFRANTLAEAQQWKKALDTMLLLATATYLKRNEWLISGGQWEPVVRAYRQEYAALLTEGDVFKKWPEKRTFSAGGVSRKIWASPDLSSLNWGEFEQQAKAKGSILIEDIAFIREEGVDQCKFFVVSIGRTLELEAKSPQVRDKWVRALRFFLAFGTGVQSSSSLRSTSDSKGPNGARSPTSASAASGDLSD